MADRYQDLQEAASKSYDLTKQYAQAKREVDMDVLGAPVSGVIQNLAVAGLGTVVQSGQTVVTIAPTAHTLIVEADLPARDAGFISVGQTIKVTAYPFEQYGFIPGNLERISPTAEPTSDLLSIPIGDSHEPVVPTSAGAPEKTSGDMSAPPTLHYRVTLIPERSWLLVDGVRQNMRPGMTVAVDVETGRRRVLAFFLDPLIKYLHNGLDVR